MLGSAPAATLTPARSKRPTACSSSMRSNIRVSVGCSATRSATTSKPLSMLIDTHCHLDHTHGNVVFEDLPILAHDKCLAAMKAALGPLSGDRWEITDFSTKLRILFGTNVNELVPEGDPYRAWFHKRIGLPDYDVVTIVPPTQTFADQFVFHLPNETVRLEYWGPAHCDNDIVVYLEKSKVIFLGDLVFNGRYPWLGDGNLDGWIDRLSHVMTLDIAVAIPGHGPPTDMKEVERFRDMLIGIRSRRRKGDQGRLVGRGSGARRSGAGVCARQPLQGMDADRREGCLSADARKVMARASV